MFWVLSHTSHSKAVNYGDEKQKTLVWSLTLVNYELGSGKLLLSSVTMTLNAESLFKTLFSFSNYPALLSLVSSENDNLQPIRH